MTFAAVIGTLDQVDILRRCIEQLRRIGVTRFIVLDYGSSDGTLDYLARMADDGHLTVLDASTEESYEAADRTMLDLVRSSGADWVLFLDSDEFWLPASGSLHTLPDLDEADFLFVWRYNVVLGPDGAILPIELETTDYHQVLLHGQPTTRPFLNVGYEPGAVWIEATLEPKIMVRPEAIHAMRSIATAE